MPQSRSIQISLTEPQAAMFLSTDKYPAFVGGFGCGKSEVMAVSAIRDALTSSSSLIGIYEPTYDLIRLIMAPRLQERLSDCGISYKYNKQEQMIYTSTTGCGDFVLRTMEKPERIVGYETYRSHVDELDTLKMVRAADVMRRVQSRNRQKLKGIKEQMNRVCAYTTPEGFRYVYHTWVKSPKPGYVLYRAKTLSNPFLPDDYVQSLRDSYPANLIEAYLNGEFVNMQSGAVYTSFDRKLNNCLDSVLPNDQLHIGMDFNIRKMSAVVLVIRDGQPRVVDEFFGQDDTPAMIRAIKLRYPKHKVAVYPDASGQSGSSTSASLSDHSLLRQAEFAVVVDLANPGVRDRVLAVNGLLCNMEGERRLLINVAACPNLVECLEQQAYDDKGDPDKKSGHDHLPDSLGYACVKMFPVVKRVATRRPLRI